MLTWQEKSWKKWGLFWKRATVKRDGEEKGGELISGSGSNQIEKVKYFLMLTLIYSVVGLVYVGNFRD